MSGDDERVHENSVEIFIVIQLFLITKIWCLLGGISRGFLQLFFCLREYFVLPQTFLMTEASHNFLNDFLSEVYVWIYLSLPRFWVVHYVP